MTRRNLILIIAFLLNSIKTDAQFLIGCTEGFSKSFFRCKDNNDGGPGNFTTGSDYTFGFFYKERTDKHLTLAMDLCHLSRHTYGEIFPYNGHGGGVSIHSTFDFKSIDFKIAPEFSIGKNFRFYLNTGPLFSYIFHTKVNGYKYSWSYSGTFPYTSSQYTTFNGTSSDFISGLELGWTSQFGFELPIGKKIKIHTEANYNIGLTSATQTELNYFSIKSNTFYIAFGISYSFAAKCISKKIKTYFEQHPNTEKTTYLEK